MDKPEAVVAEDQQKRTVESEKAIPFIATAVEEVYYRLNYLPMRPAMVLIQNKAARIRRREVRRALTKINEDDYETRQVIDKMTPMLARKLLCDPMICFSKVIGTDEKGKYQKMLRDMCRLEE